MFVRLRPSSPVVSTACLVGAVSVLAAGCRSETEGPDEGATSTPDAASPPTQVVTPPTPATGDATTSAVRACLGWDLSAPVCRMGNDLVAFGLGEDIADPSLARASAAQRARAELAERLGQSTPVVRLQGTRVPRVLPCEGRQLALAVIPTQLDVESCPAGFATLRSPEPAAAEPVPSDPSGEPGCPDWTLGFAEQTELGYMGVGAARGLSSPTLAEQTARHRAINNALSVRETELRNGVALQLGDRAATSLLSSRTARCDDVTYVEVEVKLAE